MELELESGGGESFLPPFFLLFFLSFHLLPLSLSPITPISPLPELRVSVGYAMKEAAAERDLHDAVGGTVALFLFSFFDFLKFFFGVFSCEFFFRFWWFEVEVEVREEKKRKKNSART